MFTSKHFESKHFASKHFTIFGVGNFIFSINHKSALEYLKVSTLKIKQNMNNRSTASFTLVGIGGYTPEIGHEVVIEQSPCKGEPFKRIFAGNIKDISSQNSYCGKTVFHDVTCVDYHAILDRRLVINIYPAQSVQSLIERIWADYLEQEGITLENVNAEYLEIAKTVFSYVKVSKAFNDISNVSGLFWYIDFYKGLHFFVRSSQTTGAVLSPDCEESQNTNNEFCYFINNQVCNKGIRHGHISVERRSDQLVNRQYIIAGNDETDERTDSFVGDGKRRTFNLKYKLSTLIKNADGTLRPDAIQVNGVDQTFAERDSETTAKWYYEKGESGIVQDDAETELTDSDILTVSYKGLFVVVRQRSNETSISERSNIEGSSGIYEDVFDDESIESGEYASQLAGGLVRKFSKIPISINFKSDTQVLSIGDILSVKLNDHKIDINNGFLVNSVEIDEEDGSIFHFYYELISTENLGGWQDYYKKIEYFGRQLKLKEQNKIYAIDDLPEGILVGQTFTSSTGITDLETQDENYERCLCHIGRALVNYNFHCVPQVVKLGLV